MPAPLSSPSLRLSSAALAALVLSLFALATAGCELLQPTDKDIAEAHSLPTEGEVVRDQYGTFQLRGEPTTYERRQGQLAPFLGR